MNLQMFFQKRREIEASIAATYVVVMSLNTNDGGKGGQLTEVSRANAAHLIADARSRLATETEAGEYYEQAAKAREAAEQAAAARVPLAVLSEQDLRSLRSSLRSQKG